jgi:hypothetical protein
MSGVEGNSPTSPNPCLRGNHKSSIPYVISPSSGVATIHHHPMSFSPSPYRGCSLPRPSQPPLCHSLASPNVISEKADHAIPAPAGIQPFSMSFPASSMSSFPSFTCEGQESSPSLCHSRVNGNPGVVPGGGGGGCSPTSLVSCLPGQTTISAWPIGTSVIHGFGLLVYA